MNKSELLPIEHHVRSILVANLDESETLIVGISGGADSVALLTILARLDWPVHAVHVNYQARGEESEEDQRFVTLLCEHLSVPLSIEQAPKALAEGNFQDWARGRRYEVFRKYLADQKAAGIAVAHHHEDQLETILQKIMRGAGPESWTGMEVWNGEIIRPLLSYSKRDLLTYLENIGQRYRTDSSNLETGYARNFLRHEWMPKLNQLFPGWQKNLLRLGDFSDQFDEALSWITKQVIDERGGLSKADWLEMPAGLQIAALQHWVRQEGNYKTLSHGQLKDWADALPKMQVGQYIPISAQKAIWVERDVFRISEMMEESRVVEAKPIDKEALPVSVAGIRFEQKVLASSEWMDHLCVDFEKVKGPLTIRPWRPGDRIQPLGMEGEKKISDLLTDAKIPSHKRANARVILTFEESICAVIFPPIQNRALAGVIADPYKCDTNTKSCLVIQKTDSDT